MVKELQKDAQTQDTQTLSVSVPDPGYSKVGYVNIRGASLNYVVGRAHNKESAHCSARAD